MLLLLLRLGATSAVAAASETPLRFEAELADGSRPKAAQLVDWHHDGGTPRIGDQPLFDAARPMLWLCDHSLPPAAPPAAMVETICGDRLPGVVLSFRSSGVYDRQSLPDHFLLRPNVPVTRPDDPAPGSLPILARFVRRIVWQRAPAAADAYQPGTLFYRDGRVTTFRSARFAEGEVQLLLKEGFGRATLAEIAEIHLPWRDPWQSYADELAVLDPALKARLIQYETTDGRVVTGSLARFRAGHHGDANRSDDWWHAIQPAWCPELIWIPHRIVRMRRSFSPVEVPLARIAPIESVRRGMLVSGGWPWQVNLSARRAPPRNGGQLCGWGFGVHAYSELRFPLPPWARIFRTRLGLDEAAGTGGCVRADVVASWRPAQPLFQSPILVGSQQTLDTGLIALDVPSDAAPSLILRVDPAHDQRPAGADPFEIRDLFNWIEPVVVLDPAELGAAVAGRLAETIPAWNGWRLTAADGKADEPAPHFDNRWDEHWPPRGRFHTTVLAPKDGLRLTRRLTVGPDDRWLVPSAMIYHDYSERPLLRFYVDGRLMEQKKIPLRDGNNRSLIGEVFSLLPYQGHTIDVELEQTSGDERLGVWWNAITTRRHLPTLYTAFEDDGTWTAVDPAAGGEVTVVDEHFSGRKAARFPGGAGRWRLGPFDPPLFGPDSPAAGTYRYLRLAVRRLGRGPVFIELETADEAEPRAARGIMLGRGNWPFQKTKRALGGELSTEWNVVTVDLDELKPLNFHALVFSAPEAESVLIDGVYLAEWAHHLELLPRPPAEEVANSDYRRKWLEEFPKQRAKCFARVEVDGRATLGLVCRSQEYLLAPGHVLLRPGREVAVHFSDGRTVKGTTLGIDRTTDCGVVRLAEPFPEYPGDLGDWNEWVAVRWFFVAEGKDDGSGGMALETHCAEIISWTDQVVWIAREPAGALPGGWLCHCEGTPFGHRIGPGPNGGSLYALVGPSKNRWEQLTKGEMLGQWLLGAGPTLGVAFDAQAADCVVLGAAASKSSPLEAGDIVEAVDGSPVRRPHDIERILTAKDPGEEVKVSLRRAGRTMEVRVRLVPREP